MKSVRSSCLVLAVYFIAVDQTLWSCWKCKL